MEIEDNGKIKKTLNYKKTFFFSSNHHGVEISVIWLVQTGAIKLLILIRYYGKTNFEVQRRFNTNTTLVALFKIRFRSLFFDVEKRRQCSEVTAIPWDLL